MISWICGLLVASAAVLECGIGCLNETSVSARQIGNEWCNLACNTPFCNYDRRQDDVGDCDPSCTGSGCDPRLLGNGVCDSACDSAVCGYDWGDCGVCNSGCTLELLTNDQCDEVCNTIDCFYDQRHCQSYTCVEGCTLALLGNGVCDFECMSDWCRSDNYDCGHDNLCTSAILGNSECDEECNFEWFQWDSGDCICSPGCNLSQTQDKVCDLSCDVKTCNYDGGMCVSAKQEICSQGCRIDMIWNDECDWQCNNYQCNWDNLRCVQPTQDFCAPGCSWKMQNNEVCDEECNTESCEFDNYRCDYECNNPACGRDLGTCFCSPHCKPKFEGNCWPACMNADCEYDHFLQPGGCSSSFDVAFTLMGGLIVRDLHEYIYFDFCVKIRPQCDYGRLLNLYINKICDEDCNVPQCAYSMGMCMPPHLTCRYGHKPDEGTCMWCNSGYHNYMGYCVQVCPSGTEPRTVTHKLLDLCYNSTQVSDEETQDKLFVFGDSSIDAATVENKYSDLMDAFAGAWELYTTIFLVGEEIVFNPQSFRSRSSPDYILHPKLPDVFINARWKHLTIASLPCFQQKILGCVDGLTTLQFFNIHNNIIENKTLIFTNLTISTSKYFEFQKVGYCPFQFYKDEKLYDDRGSLVADEDIAYVSCKPFQELSAFTVQLKGELRMKVVITQNVVVANMTTQLQAFALLEGGHINLENVQFRNIQPYAGTLRPSAVFLQLNPCLNISTCGSFTYRGGSVSYMNNGYEYRFDLMLGPFVKFDSVTSLEIAGVAFYGNVILGSALSFISVRVLLTMRLSNCTVDHNFFGGSFVSVLTSPNLPNTQGATSPFAQTHITLDGLKFTNTFAKDSLIRVALSGSLQNINVNGCVFEGVALNDGVFLDVERSSRPSDLEVSGARENKIWVPPRWFNLSNCSFRNVTSFQSLILLINLANIRLANITVEQSGDAVRGEKTVIMMESLNYPLLYMKKLPAYASSTKCSQMFNLRQVVNFESQNVSITHSQCLLDSVGFAVSDSSGVTTLRKYYFAQNVGVRNIALHLSNVASTLLTDFEGRNNTQTSSGLIGVLEQSSLEMRNSLCYGNTGQQGACIHAEQNLNLVVFNSSFISNSAPVTDGGAIYILSSLHYSSSVRILDCEFTANSAFRGGAIAVTAYAEDRPVLLHVARSEFRKNTASTSGSALFTDTTLSVRNDSALEFCSFIEEQAKDGVVAFVHGQGNLEVSNSLFHRNSGTVCSGIDIETGPSAAINLRNVTFQWSSQGPPLLKSSTKATSVFNTTRCRFLFSEMQVALMAGVFWVDDSSEFRGSNASAVVLLNATALFRRSVFTHNANEGNAGAVLLEQASTFRCDGCSFLNNSAKALGGVLWGDQDSEVALRDCVVAGNSALRGAAVYVVLSSRTSTFTNVTFQHNSAVHSATVYGYRVNLVFTSSKIRENQGPETPGLVLLSSNLTVVGCQFLTQSGQKAAFLSLEIASTAHVSSSSFINGTGVETAVAETLNSTLSVVNSTFSGCKGRLTGLLSAADGSYVELIGVTAAATSTPGSGSIINIKDSSLVVGKSSFTRYSPGGIAGKSLKSLLVYNSTFSEGKAGSAVHCEQCENVTLQQSNFTKHFGSEGAVWLGGCAQVSISHVLFAQNQADTAGALYLSDSFVTIASSTFKSNSALTGDGGAVVERCSGLLTCSLKVDFGTFENNTAKQSGGAIKWNSVKPLLSAVKMMRNAALYGADIASFPAFLSVSVLTDNRNSGLTVMNVAAGQSANTSIVAQLLDLYGQRVVVDSSSEAKLAPVHSQLAFVSGSTQSTALNGEFTFSNFSVFGKPGTTVEIELSSASLPSVVITVQLRKCQAGESATSISCSHCAETTYSLNPDLPCQMCPQHAVCPGKELILPKSGYWRATANSTKIWQCPRKSSCLGGTRANSTRVTGYCAEGYEGNMCQTCSKGYFRRGTNACQLCPSTVQNYFIGIFVLLAILAIVGVLVWAARKAALDKSSVQVAYYRVLVNYSQLMFILAAFNLNWPEEVKAISNAQEDSGSSVYSVFSIDCFLLNEGYTDKFFYAKRTFASIFPVGLFLLLFVCSMVAVCLHGRFAHFRSHLLSSIIIIYLLIYPTLVTSFFQLFSCVQIEEGEYWLFAEMSIRCWNEEHYKYALVLGTPSVIVWVFGLPLLCLLALVKLQRRLQDPTVRLQFSFLVGGYRRESYYWELWIGVRKVAIIACSLYFQLLYNAQALAVSLLLVLSLFSQYVNNPFATRRLNALEYKSIAVELATVYTGVYFLTGDLSKGASLMLFSLVAIANLMFLIGWFVYVGIDIVQEHSAYSLNGEAGDPELRFFISTMQGPAQVLSVSTVKEVYRVLVNQPLAKVPAKYCSLLSWQSRSTITRRGTPFKSLLTRNSKVYSSLSMRVSHR